MARAIFVDASAWIALSWPADKYHVRAGQIWNELVANDWPLCTTNWTLYEAVTFLTCSVRRHQWGIELLERALESATVLKADALEQEAVATFRKHGDRRWSVVDCANFQALRQHGCEQAFAFDHNFRQAQLEFGFTVLS